MSARMGIGTLDGAIDEIDRLSAENERLRAEASYEVGLADVAVAQAQREAAVSELVRAATEVRDWIERENDGTGCKSLRSAIAALRSAWPGIGE